MPGTTLEFGGSFETYELDASSSIASAGTVQFSGGTTTVDGSYAANRTTIAGGTAAFNTDFSGFTLTMNGGTLTGAGTVTVTDKLEWSGGTMAGTGKTVLASGGTGVFSGTESDNSKGLARTLENAGDDRPTRERGFWFWSGGGDGWRYRQPGRRPVSM